MMVYAVHMDTNTNRMATAVAAAIGLSNMSIAAVSASAGIPRTTLNNRLSGRTDFTVREIALISQALNTTPDRIIPSEILTGKAAA